MIPIDITLRAASSDIAYVAAMLGADMKRSMVNIPCPGCGGTDRFSIDKARNIFFCRFSGLGGDPIDLVRHVRGCRFDEAVEMLTGETATPPPAHKPPPSKSDVDYRRKAMERGYRIWRAGDTPAELVPRYLDIRRIPMPTWRLRTIREARILPYWHFNGKRKRFEVIHEGPAMLAAITGPDGKFIGCHRTWLDFTKPKGKAEIFDPETGELLPAKKVEGSLKGGRIVLREGDGIVIGEGIETVLAYDALRPSEAALWSGVSLGNIAGRAMGTMFHPTLKSGNRRAKVANAEPDMSDDACLSWDTDALLLGDSDSDAFTTRLALARAAKRHGGVVEWAPDGMDFSDVLYASV